MASIEKNLEKIREKIKFHAEKIGRPPEEIEIVAVAKGRSIEEIEQAAAAGSKIIGENRVQEAQKKSPQTKSPVEWHLVGHLQTNKAKIACEIFSLIHSVDSLKLAQVLNQQAEKQNKIQGILAEINVSEEATKFGFSEKDFFLALAEISNLKNLALRGIMTLAPYSENQESSRPYFKKLCEIFEQVKKMELTGVEMKWLSAGMSQDYEVAVEEGANLLRIGRAIFENNN